MSQCKCWIFHFSAHSKSKSSSSRYLLSFHINKCKHPRHFWALHHKRFERPQSITPNLYSKPVIPRCETILEFWFSIGSSKLNDNCRKLYSGLTIAAISCVTFHSQHAQWLCFFDTFDTSTCVSSYVLTCSASLQVQNNTDGLKGIIQQKHPLLSRLSYNYTQGQNMPVSLGFF